MPQENAVVMTLFQFCTMNEVQNVDNAITLKIFSNANSVKFMQQQLHRCQHVTQLLAQLLVTTAVHHVHQSLAIKLHCSAAC